MENKNNNPTNTSGFMNQQIAGNNFMNGQAGTQQQAPSHHSNVGPGGIDAQKMLGGFNVNTQQSAYHGATSNSTNNMIAGNQMQMQDEFQNAGGKQKSSGKKFLNNFFTKTVVAALIFGIVGGGIFTTVSYFGTKAIGGQQEQSGIVKTNASTKSSNVKQTASGFATDITDVSGVVEETMPSIVAITNSGTVTYNTVLGRQGTYESQSCGSGIIVSEDDEYLYVATNNHVVVDSNELTVQFCDETVVEAEIRGTKPDKDLAVIRIAKSDIEKETLETIKIATIGDSDAIKVGNATIAIGNALGYGQTVTTGIVSAVGRTVTTADPSTGIQYTNDSLIQTDAAINPGNSGGALLNASGEVIGINSAKYSSTDVEGTGYAIPMSVAQPIIDSLIQNGEYYDSDQGYLGISGGDVSSRMIAYGLPEGAYVGAVNKDSGAEKAGIKEGDIITAVDGKKVKGMDDLQKAIEGKKPGDEITVSISREENGKNQNQDLKVTLGKSE